MKIERFLTIQILLTIAMLASAGVACGEITAPDCVNAGELVIAQSDEPATWKVFPEEYQTAFAVVNDGRSCAFASPIKGRVTLIAASVVDGKAVLDTHTLYNGVKKEEPVIPDEQIDEDSLEGIAKKEGKEKAPASLTALAESFESVVSGIERGTVMTVPGARETLRKEWIRKAALMNPNAMEEMGSLLEQVSSKIDYMNLESVKKDFSTVANALRELVPKLESEKPKHEEAEKKVEDNQKSCPNGTCPNVQNYNGGFFRWR